jgi:hypothetical protein
MTIINKQALELAEAKTKIARLKDQHRNDKETIDRIGAYFANARTYISNSTGRDDPVDYKGGIRE